MVSLNRNKVNLYVDLVNLKLFTFIVVYYLIRRITLIKTCISTINLNSDYIIIILLWKFNWIVEKKKKNMMY